ncbi:MAG: GNAT family N-acetyltransferase [Planctomycetota bacterium]
MEIVKQLDWDSALFGFPVAAITAPRLTAAELDDALRHLRQKGVRLAYWVTDPADGATQAGAQGAGGFLADVRTTYAVELAKLPQIPRAAAAVAVTSYVERQSTPELDQLAIDSAVYSRFAVDPRIQREHFTALYKTWMRNSVSRSIAREVLIVEADRHVLGMATLGEKNGRGDIGLIAVTAAARGRSYGTALMFRAADWFRAAGLGAAQVVTQGRNTAANRFYERCGYRVEKREHTYHLWL